MPSVIDQRLASRFHQLQLEKVLRVEGVSDEIQARIELTLREIIRVLAGTQSIEKKTRIAGELLRRMVPVATLNAESLFERLAGWSHAATVNVLARNVPRHWMRFVNPIVVYAGEAEIPANVPIVDLLPYGFAETPTEPVAGKRLPDDQWAAFLRENVFEPPSREKVSDFIHRKINGKDWQERFTELSRKIADPDKLMNTLATQYAQGMTQDQMARNVRSQVQGIASSARRIVRTEGLRIANEAHRETYKQLGSLMSGVQILATLDENTRQHHASRNGMIYWNDGRKKPHISELPQLPDEPNCRCFDVPVLKPPAEFENDPAIRAEFSNAAGNAIPDPSVYTQWFERADGGRRRMAVGVKRYNTVQTLLQRKPEWTDFIDENGKLLSVSHLRGETERSRIARKARVDQAIASRRELISQVNRFGFTSKHLDPPKPPKKSKTRKVPAKNKSVASFAYRTGVTLQEAAEIARQLNLSDNIDYGAMSLESANALNRILFEALTEYPALRSQMKFIGSAQARNRHWVETQVRRAIDQRQKRGISVSTMDISDIRKYYRSQMERIHPGTFAQAWDDPDAGGIAIHETRTHDLRTMEQQYDNDVKDGYFSPGRRGLQGIVDHEIGHIIDDVLGITSAGAIADAEFQKLLSSTTTMDIQRGLSIYAGTKTAEIFSEAWVEYRGGNPRPIARKIGELMEKRLRQLNKTKHN